MRLKNSLAATITILGVVALGCEGPQGKPGALGAEGSEGPQGPIGPQGPGGTAIDKGTIAGTVKDLAGAGIEGVQVTTIPATQTATTSSTGAFTLADVPVGMCSVRAAKDGYDPSTLEGVGILAGVSTTVSLTLTLASGTLTTVTGAVKNTAGTALSGATVKISGTALQATTGAGGAYSISGVPLGGPYFVDVTAPAGYLDGGTRTAVWLSALTNTVADVKLSARPPSNAAYVGRAACVGCHGNDTSSFTASHKGSAHWRSITGDISRMVNLNIWPDATTETVLTNIKAQKPDGSTDRVDVYLCYDGSGYEMKFGGSADCASSDGTRVQVSGTYGGEGDSGVDGTTDQSRSLWDPKRLNLGKFKQRFLARLEDVPAASGWTYNSAQDKARDYLILPVQITQSGNGAPKLGNYSETNWATRGRTFSRNCAGCHTTGLTIAWDGQNNIVGYNYIDQNVSCERCHGPGSQHAASGGYANAIVNPLYMSAAQERQVCGQCHAADKGKSAKPSGAFGYAWNSDHSSDLGGGVYVPGVYDVSEFIGNLNTGGFDAWPGAKYGKAHRQQYTMLVGSIHANNPYERLTCASCHSPHSLKGGPSRAVRPFGASTWEFFDLRFKNNSLCLSCHAGSGPFAGLNKDDVAALQVGAGTDVKRDGDSLTDNFTASQIADAKARIGDSVVAHMHEKANMGLFVLYDPENDPGVGRCQSCHMPRTGKSGGWVAEAGYVVGLNWNTGLDDSGRTALIEGDEGSHRFDIIAPQVSRAMVATAGGKDENVMPNSCGRCHARYRFSADDK